MILWRLIQNHFQRTCNRQNNDFGRWKRDDYSLSMLSIFIQSNRLTSLRYERVCLFDMVKLYWAHQWPIDDNFISFQIVNINHVMWHSIARGTECLSRFIRLLQLAHHTFDSNKETKKARKWKYVRTTYPYLRTYVVDEYIFISICHVLYSRLPK